MPFPRKRWTVLIYMVADDPQGGELLDQQAAQEMDHITKAALSVKRPDHLHVALQVDFRTLPGVWRRVIGQTTFVRPESDAANPSTLYGFFDWVATECPAEHYLLIFWGHSRGQFGIFADPDPFDYTAQTLTLGELRDALMAARRSLEKPVDVIAFKDCFMANLETAYELSGLADYLLASPGLVPVVGWPYDEMFQALADNDPRNLPPDQRGLAAAKQILTALRNHYEKPNSKGLHAEVPYSLLSTRGAVNAVEKLRDLVGEGRMHDAELDDSWLREQLEQSASKAGDPALVDLGTLALYQAAPQTQQQAATKVSTRFKALAQTLGNARPGLPDAQAAAPEQLVIDHTGQKFGGVSIFVYPSTSKGQRDSRLTRLADEKAYRRLAISTDTNWADIALQSMPIQPIQPVQDVSKAIALFEQLDRLGVGMVSRSAVRARAYLRRRARRSRNGDLTEADVAEATEYAAIAELAVRLADFAADKGGADFADKGGADFADKGGADFADKGGADFGPKGGADFGPG